MASRSLSIQFTSSRQIDSKNITFFHLFIINIHRTEVVKVFEVKTVLGALSKNCVDIELD